MRFHPTTTLSYLRRHYFDDDMLRDYAISEFIRALRTGRLIAFTGSLTTEIYRYPGWTKMLHLALDSAARELRKASHLDPDTRRKYSNTIRTLKEVAKRDKNFDGRVAFSAVAQMLDHVSLHDQGPSVTANIARLFLTSKAPSGVDGRPTSSSALFDDLGVGRIVTTNYDFELESRAMGAEPQRVGPDRRIGKLLEKLINELKTCATTGSASDYSLKFQHANAQRVVSDIMQRDQPEALIEFAIGCPEIDKHIFHLHGRADLPDEMIVSYRDYDRLYRRSDLGKAPFEHALRILFAGNPVLFVGLGMSEPEVNATLAEFVGNHPYSRKAPGFLIWNTPKPWIALGKHQNDGAFYSEKQSYPQITVEQRKTAFRLDMLHRLGVLTIFADDLGATRSNSLSDGEQLRRSLVALSARAVKEHARRRMRVPLLRWRRALTRVQRGLDPIKNPSRIIDTWTVDWPKLLAGTVDSGEPDINDKINSHFMTILVRPPGAGKTGQAREIAEKWIGAHPDGWALIVNFNLRIDTDSILALIAALFRYDPRKSERANLTQRSSRETQFRDRSCRGVKNQKPLLIVLKGLERIFDVNGHPLSAEFDQFLRIMIERQASLGSVRFAVLGTERIRRYFDGWKRAEGRMLVGPKPADQIWFEDLTPQQAANPKLPYLSGLKLRFRLKPIERARQNNKALVDYAAQRRTTFKAVLTTEALHGVGIREPNLALDIITIMSFIGQPVERAVLFHAPRIRRRLKLHLGRTERSARGRLNRAIDQLSKAGLIGEVNERPGKQGHEKRYAVHISLQSEIRDRYAVPLSDSILSTAYNMSLYAAQPGDGALPEAELHDELGQLVDWLIAAYKDPPFDPGAVVNDRAAPHVVAAFRAGFSLIRGLYSTSALLSVDRGDRLISDERDGLMTEHAQRLERMLAAFDESWRARKALLSPIGAEPLYPDELVWLHNERGVVKLAQGDLYEARFSFDEADRINRQHVEFHDESHNWRRITLNQIVVDIGRGKLQAADDRMNAIECRLGPDKSEHIRTKYFESLSPRRIRFDEVVSHEDILAMALITGYRGLVSHLRGELDAASSYLERAIGVLQRMDEQRALALFRRHKASVLSDLGDIRALHRECRLSMAGAESVRQLDIVYASRLMDASYPDESAASLNEIRVLTTALEALEYATLADMHRLALEAQAHLARAKMLSGDYDAALEHASEAMALATRYGLTLYKVGLRTLLGELLVKRGTVESGRILIRNAINGAMRVGYQRAIEAARRTLVESN